MGSKRSVTKLKKPFERSASTASAIAEQDVKSEGLMTTVQPAAWVDATFRLITAFAEFLGVTNPQITTGSLIAKIFFPCSGLGMSQPLIHLVSSANQRTNAP